MIKSPNKIKIKFYFNTACIEKIKTNKEIKYKKQIKTKTKKYLILLCLYVELEAVVRPGIKTFVRSFLSQ